MADVGGCLWVAVLLVGCGDQAEPDKGAEEAASKAKDRVVLEDRGTAQALSVMDVSELDIAGASAWWCRFRRRSTRISASIRC